MPTSFSIKCEILAEAYLESAYNPDLDDFVKFCNIGLPLAYLINQDLVEPKGEKSLEYLDNTWSIFCDSLGLDPNGDYKNVEDFLSQQKVDDEDEED